MLRVRLAFLICLLVCLAMTARQLHRPNLADFQVYDAAAELVHEHQSAHIYDDADTGALFGLRFVKPDLPLGQAARRLGIQRVRLYIYPPILADLLVPLTFVSAATAGKLWLCINLAALLLTTFLVAGLLNVRWRSFGGLALLVGLFALFSTLFCLVWGQVTIVLLLLWTAGLACYQRRWYAASAALFALATAIKLTPLLVIVPLLIWRERKWLIAFLTSLAILIGVMFAVNGTASLHDYIAHVMPSMSGGVPDLQNKSLFSSSEMLWVSLHGGAIDPTVTLAVPRLVASGAKALSAAILIGALLLVFRLGRRMSMDNRLLALALFALLSVAVAPISWKHAYVVAFLPLALLWTRAFRGGISSFHLLLLSFCSIELGSFLFDSIAIKVTHGVLLGLLSFLAPATAILLALAVLASMRRTEVA